MDDETQLNGNKGAFRASIGAIESNDINRKVMAEEDAITALSCVSSMLNVVSDYVYIKRENPNASLYANDSDLAITLYSLADLTTCIHSSLVEASDARFYLDHKQTEKK